MEKIYFVGAGPGDKDLITLKGYKLLSQADIVIYAGSLVNPDLLDYCKSGAKLYDSASMNLEEIIDLMKEGVEKDLAEGLALYWFPVHIEGISWEERKARSYELSRHEYEGKPGVYFWGTPQEAYAALIDKINGKGTWESNPYVWAYDFELVK